MYTNLLFPFLILGSCSGIYSSVPATEKAAPIAVKRSISTDNPYSNINKIPLPAGYRRIEADSGSFAAWLQDLPLKKDKIVYLFNGSPKVNQSAQFAVLDISIGNKDLQQCADAVMRLRAEYLFAGKQFGQIIFIDNAGTAYHFCQPYNRQNFKNYLERVFGMCGSASLSKQLHRVALNTLQPGDVFIRGGFPGHAEMVMDLAVNKEGKKIYLLAQSYMPAQDIHLLINPVNNTLSPWYELSETAFIETPEYTFNNDELKRW